MGSLEAPGGEPGSGEVGVRGRGPPPVEALLQGDEIQAGVGTRAQGPPVFVASGNLHLPFAASVSFHARQE